jgi:hypothetical protein
MDLLLFLLVIDRKQLLLRLLELSWFVSSCVLRPFRHFLPRPPVLLFLLFAAAVAGIDGSSVSTAEWGLRVALSLRPSPPFLVCSD